MRDLGKIGVTLVLSLILSVTLFTSGVFAQSIGSHSNSNTVSYSILARQAVEPDPTHQSLDAQQSTNQQTNYPQMDYQRTTQGNDDCDWLNNCQHSTRCTRIFRSAWGWMFICHGW